MRSYKLTESHLYFSLKANAASAADQFVRRLCTDANGQGSVAPSLSPRFSFSYSLRHSAGLLTIFAEANDDGDMLVRHRVEMQYYETAARVIRRLLTKVRNSPIQKSLLLLPTHCLYFVRQLERPIQEAELFSLCLLGAAGIQGRVSDDCRPLLMQVSESV